ncbi:MAG: HNH endonuclease [Brevinema sp.]
MNISLTTKHKHDELLKKIQDTILDELKTNLTTAKIAKQRFSSFISLYDMFDYIDKYNPNIPNSKAYSQINKSENISYNYFEECLIPCLKKAQKKYPTLFEIKGIDLLEQGFLDHTPVNVYTIFSIANFWGAAQSYSFQKVKTTNNIHIHFITNSKQTPSDECIYNSTPDQTETSIYTKSIEQVLGSFIYLFYRETEKDKFHLVDKYLALPPYRLSTKEPLWSYITIQKCSSLSPNQQLDVLTELQLSTNISENRKQEITSSAYFRSQQEKLKALQRANNRCENRACSKQVPFIKSDHSTYLEVHHIIPLSQNGIDHEKNLIALCPNCHREAHHGQNKNSLRDQFQIIINNKY